MTDPADFHHLQEPPDAGEDRYLLLLHGTGGDERDILSLGVIIAPTLGRLAVRGKVREGAANRYFRRLAEGVFDVEDLKARADELAAWVVAATDRYRIDRRRLTAVGFSNGANIASAMLLRHPGTFQDLALLRPMVPYQPEERTDLTGHRVLVVSGANDELTPVEHREGLRLLFTERGATVETWTLPTGHGLVRADLDLVRDWLGRGG